MPDSQLAKIAKVHHNTIHHERRRRGIPSFRPMSEPVRWTEAMIRKLGTATDREVAAELGVPLGSVGRKRRILGIPPFTRQSGSGRPGYPWSAEEVACLGKVPDRALAAEMGLSTATVANKRLSLGIAPCHQRPKPVHWTEEMIDLLGKIPDMEIARRFSISSTSVVQKRRRLGIAPVMDRRGIELTPELIRLLLTLPPTEVRRRTGLNLKTIAKFQKALGTRKRPSELRYSPEVVARMGKEPDYVIAADLGVSDSAVRLKRHELGIPAYDGHRRRARRK